MRDTTIFYRSFYEAIKDLPADSQGRMYNAIFSYSLDGVKPELNGIESTIFKLIMPQLDANNKRYENGKTPKKKKKQTESDADGMQNESKTEAKQKQELSKEEANKNKNNNKNENNNKKDIYEGAEAPQPTTPLNKKTLALRKAEFRIKLKPYVGKYPDQMLKEFHDYWTEPNRSQTKMRFELEPTYDIKLRLIRWANNDKSIQTNNETPVTITGDIPKKL